tara:strand:+ start:3618 stop:3761 length:144 start_codon:yes stop_codon:yes gene_type:complete
MNKIYMFFIIAVLGLTACEQQGPAEEAGEQIDEAAEEVADEIDDATS